MGSSCSSSSFEDKETVLETYNNLKIFISDDASKSWWYTYLKDDFEETDSAKNGYLTKEEISNTLEEYFQLKSISPTDELKEEYFKKINTSEDGKVSFDQLYQFAKGAVEMDFLPEFEEQCRAHNAIAWEV